MQLTKYKLTIYMLGAILFSLGAKFFIDSNLGVDPLDTAVIGIASNLNIKIGTASAAIAILLLAIWGIWNQKKPLFTPFFTMTFVGYLIDLWNYLIAMPETMAIYQSWGLMIIGLIVCSYASSLIIMSGIGIRTMDLVAITITEKCSVPFSVSRGILGACFTIAGYLLGGPVGVGTLAFLFLVGPLIQLFIMLNEHKLKLVNYGTGKCIELV